MGRGVIFEQANWLYPRQLPNTATLFWRVRAFSRMDTSCVVPAGLGAREQSLAHLICWYNVM